MALLPPRLTVQNLGDGSTAKATLAGTEESLHRVYGAKVSSGRKHGVYSPMTLMGSRLGDGALEIPELAQGARYTFVATSEIGGESSAPSFPAVVEIFRDGDVPVIERCALEIFARLEELVEEGLVTHAQRPTRNGVVVAPMHRGVVLVQANDPRESPERDDEKPYGMKQWAEMFEIDCYLKPPEGDDVPIDTQVNLLRAVVEKKLREDPTLGGNAIDLRIRPPEGFITTDGGYEGVTVNVEVLFRHDEDNPFVQR